MRHPSSNPLVSVGIPLYRSRRFLDIIVDNIEAITYPNVEIIVSDQHLLDDTTEVPADDSAEMLARFRGRTASRVENFNPAAQRRAFLYNDDSYPTNYIRELPPP
jgi:hypothetical protein